MRRDVDLAILGGGCAGLSLATRLVGSGLRVAVIEPRRRYSADRAWSYWSLAPHPFQDCVVARWTRWRVGTAQHKAIRSHDGFGYETVDAGLFYAACQHRLRRDDAITLMRGTSAELAEATKTGVRLALSGDQGGTLFARHVVDTRPLQGAPRYGQWFVGQEIETDASCFDPAACDLMRFGAARQDRIDFTYVLPFTDRRALVEATVFSDTAPAEAVLQDAQNAAITAETRGSRYRVIRREAGMVPMDAGFADQQERPNVVPFGVRGGAARPSTGYAFARIQARADALAHCLRHRKTPEAPRPDGPVTRAMDRLFLRVITRHPELGPALFTQLFERCSDARLERFLSGSTAWADRLAVMSALPTRLFLSHLVKP